MDSFNISREFIEALFGCLCNMKPESFISMSHFLQAQNCMVELNKILKMKPQEVVKPVEPVVV